MTTTLEVVSPGALATIQDLGRTGWRRFGVPRAGALDPAQLRIANTLVGNPEGAAAIEFFVAGPTLKAIDEPVQLGFAGDFSITLQRVDGERRQLDGWRSVTLQPGETLRIGAPRAARGGIVAVRGLHVAPVLGSAATYTRARLGGQCGRALAAGDRLTVATLPSTGRPAPPDRRLPRPPVVGHRPIRAVPGPQDDHFDADQLAAFFATAYRV